MGMQKLPVPEGTCQKNLWNEDTLKGRLRANKTYCKGISEIKINKVSPELAIDLTRSYPLSGNEQLRKVKIDKACLKIACFGKLSTP